MNKSVIYVSMIFLSINPSPKQKHHLKYKPPSRFVEIVDITKMSGMFMSRKYVTFLCDVFM